MKDIGHKTKAKQKDIKTLSRALKSLKTKEQNSQTISIQEGDFEEFFAQRLSEIVAILVDGLNEEESRRDVERGIETRSPNQRVTWRKMGGGGG